MIGRLAAFWHGCPAGLKEAYASFAVQSLIALAYSLNRYIGHAASRPGIRRFVPWAVLNLTVTFVVHLACLRALSPDYRRSISVTGFPTARGFVLEVLGSLLVFEVLFYYIHRLMHTRLFYRPVHAMHHRMTDKVCLGAFYVHPVEFLMVGFGAFMGAVALTRTHFPTMLFLGVVAELAGLYFHELGEVSGVMSHESHHVRGAKNFGSIGLMDVLHGTFMKTCRWFFAPCEYGTWPSADVVFSEIACSCMCDEGEGVVARRRDEYIPCSIFMCVPKPATTSSDVTLHVHVGIHVMSHVVFSLHDQHACWHLDRGPAFGLCFHVASPTQCRLPLWRHATPALSQFAGWHLAFEQQSHCTCQVAGLPPSKSVQCLFQSSDVRVSSCLVIYRPAQDSNDCRFQDVPGIQLLV